MTTISTENGYMAIEDAHIRSAIATIASGIDGAGENMAYYYEGAVAMLAHMADMDTDDVAMLVADCCITKGIEDVPAYFKRYMNRAYDARAARQFNRKLEAQREIAEYNAENCDGVKQSEWRLMLWLTNNGFARYDGDGKLWTLRDENGNIFVIEVHKYRSGAQASYEIRHRDMAA